jgi:hypothetical protein
MLKFKIYFSKKSKTAQTNPDIWAATGFPLIVPILKNNKNNSSKGASCRSLFPAGFCKFFTIGGYPLQSLPHRKPVRIKKIFQQWKNQY